MQVRMLFSQENGRRNGEEDRGEEGRMQELGKDGFTLPGHHLLHHHKALPDWPLVHVFNEQTNVHHCLSGARFREHRHQKD